MSETARPSFRKVLEHGKRTRLQGKPVGTRGAGWIPHFYSTGGAGQRDAWIEKWLADEFDSRGPAFLDALHAGRVTTPDERFFAAETVMVQALRTPRGRQDSFNIWPEDENPTEDDVRRRLGEFMTIGRSQRNWVIKDARWSLARPPEGRLFVISDYPATSRLNDWSELGPSDRAQVSLPISPTACLI